MRSKSLYGCLQGQDEVSWLAVYIVQAADETTGHQLVLSLLSARTFRERSTSP